MIADKGLVLALLVLKADGIVDVCVSQLDEDLLVDVGSEHGPFETRSGARRLLLCRIRHHNAANLPQPG